MDLPLFLRPTSSDPGNYKLITFDPVRHLQEDGWVARQPTQGLPGRPHPLNQVNASAAASPLTTRHNPAPHTRTLRTAHPNPKQPPSPSRPIGKARARAGGGLISHFSLAVDVMSTFFARAAYCPRAPRPRAAQERGACGRLPYRVSESPTPTIGRDDDPYCPTGRTTAADPRAHENDLRAYLFP